jgi:Trk-type K+ transport system membrane component
MGSILGITFGSGKGTANWMDRWLGVFNGVSAFNNSGMSLLDANMVYPTTGVQGQVLIKYRSRSKLQSTYS